MSALGAYRDTDAFAYPGWRLTVPGGPAGGHYKGFTHNTEITNVLPESTYETFRDAGMAAHDDAHVHPNAPRGVYRGPAEVPPRPNASGAAMQYRGFQTKRHAGTSVAPGSFPADFYETDEDVLATLVGGPKQAMGYILPRAAVNGSSVYTATPAQEQFPLAPPNSQVVNVRPVVFPGPMPVAPIITRPIFLGPYVPKPPMPAPVSQTQIPSPAPSVPAPISPSGTAPPLAPAPSVPSGVVSPDGSGNFVDSFGQVYSSSQVTLDPTTNQYRLIPGSTPSALASASNWLSQNTIYAAWPNWYFVAGGAAGLLLLFMGGRRHR